MTAYLVLIFAALSRCIPHWTHTVGVGLTASGAGLIFFGSRLTRTRSRWQSLLAVALFAAVDYYLTTFAYGYPFHVASYFFTWAWYAAVVLFASHLLSSRRTALRVVASALFSATGFFLISNAEAWWSFNMYPRTLNGLATAYIAGLPFYGNDLVSTLLLCGALFGLPALVRDFQNGEAVQPR